MKNPTLSVCCQGIGLLTLSSWPTMGRMPGSDEDNKWWSYAMLCGSLSVIALGTGAAPNLDRRINAPTGCGQSMVLC